MRIRDLGRTISVDMPSRALGSGGLRTAGRIWRGLAAILGFVALLVPGLLSAMPGASAGLKPQTVEDLQGSPRTVPDARSRATVLLFVAHDCPIANRYTPEVNRICTDYAARGVTFMIVYAEPALSTAAARAHARSFGYGCPAVLDPKGRLARNVGATVTPEAVVLTPAGKLVYRGRIDDLYIDYGKQRPAPTRRYLRDALEAVLAGRPAPVRITKPLGCFIAVD